MEPTFKQRIIIGLKGAWIAMWAKWNAPLFGPPADLSKGVRYVEQELEKIWNTEQKETN